MKPLRPFVLLCAIVLASGTPVPPNVPIKDSLIDPVSRDHAGSQVPTSGATENPPRRSHDESVIVVASPYKRKAQDPTAEGLPPKRFRHILSAPRDHPGSQVPPAATIEIPPRPVHKSHDQSVIAVATTGPSHMRKAQDPTAGGLPLQASGHILSAPRGHPEPQVPRAATTETPPNPGHESHEQSVVVVATTGPSPKRITETPAAEGLSPQKSGHIFSGQNTQHGNLNNGSPPPPPSSRLLPSDFSSEEQTFPKLLHDLGHTTIPERVIGLLKTKDGANRLANYFSRKKAEQVRKLNGMRHLKDKMDATEWAQAIINATHDYMGVWADWIYVEVSLLKMDQFKDQEGLRLCGIEIDHAISTAKKVYVDAKRKDVYSEEERGYFTSLMSRLRQYQEMVKDVHRPSLPFLKVESSAPILPHS